MPAVLEFREAALTQPFDGERYLNAFAELEVSFGRDPRAELERLFEQWEAGRLEIHACAAVVALLPVMPGAMN